MRALLLSALQLIGGLSMALVACIGVGHAQPSPARDFLSAEGCGSACWQGITPGQTTLADALTLLRRLPDVDANSIRVMNTLVQWDWKPGFRWARPHRGEMLSYLSIERGVVLSIGLYVAFTSGDVVSLLGAPRQLILSVDYAAINRCPYGLTLVYGEVKMRYGVVTKCDAGFPDFRLGLADGRYTINAGVDEDGVVLRRFTWSGFKPINRYVTRH